MSGAAPTRLRGGGGYRRFARSIPDNGPMGAQGTRAIEAARRAGVPYSVHEYAHDERATLREGGRGYALEAVAALGLEPARVFKTLVVSVDGRLGIAVVPADAEVDLKAVADALGGRKADDGRPGRCRAGDGLRAGRDQPAGDAPAAADGARCLGRATGRRSTSPPGGAAWRSSWRPPTSCGSRVASRRRSPVAAERAPCDPPALRTGGRRRILPRMARGLGLAVDLAVKVAVIGLSLYPLLNPESSHFAGKAMGVRALIYPVFVLLIPVVWLAAGRPRPYPVLADIALGLPFVIDAGSNVLGLFAIPGFDALPHAIGWFCLSIAFGLAVAPLVEARWVAFLLVVGFGASIDILWEIGEYLLMRSGSSGLALTYDNTIQDLAMSFIGAVAAAIVVVTVLWPRDGTPRTPFGWSVAGGPEP